MKNLLVLGILIGMLPILMKLPGFTVYTFGLFLVLALFWSSFFLWKLVRMTSFKEDDIFDAILVSGTVALFGGRLVYVILHFSEFGFNPLKFILVNGYPGYSLYGALLGGGVAYCIYMFIKKIPIKKTLDYIIPPLFLGIAIGKLGAFFSGAEAGIQTKIFLSTRVIGFSGQRHLTSLYESCMFVCGAFISYRLLLLIRKEKIAEGLLGFFFLWFFSAIYLLTDPLKTEKILLNPYLSFNSVISLCLLLTSTIVLVYYFRIKIVGTFSHIIKTFFSYATHSIKKIRQRAKTTS